MFEIYGKGNENIEIDLVRARFFYKSSSRPSTKTFFVLLFHFFSLYVSERLRLFCHISLLEYLWALHFPSCFITSQNFSFSLPLCRLQSSRSFSHLARKLNGFVSSINSCEMTTISEKSIDSAFACVYAFHSFSTSDSMKMSTKRNEWGRKE